MKITTIYKLVIIICIVLSFLLYIKTEIDNLKLQNKYLIKENQHKRTLINNTYEQLNEKKIIINQQKQNLTNEIKLKEYYIKESKYYASLNNKLDMTPRWSDVKSFLKMNQIDKNKWSEHSYDCTAFSNDLIIEALKNNMFMCTVEIDWEENGGHIIVAVNTSDKGLVYIEPQTDNVIDLHLGLNGHSGFLDYFIISYDSCFERVIHNK